MSLRPRLVPDIPEETAPIAKAAFRKGNPYLKMRDELGAFFSDEQFLELYPLDGQPAFSPWRLALICILQFAALLGKCIYALKTVSHLQLGAFVLLMTWKLVLAASVKSHGPATSCI